LKPLFRHLNRGAELIGAAMFLLIFAAFLLQIVARYVMRSPIGWPDEAITFLFVWVVMWGGALMVPIEKQISFDLLHEVLPARWRKWTEAVCLAATALLFAAAMPVVIDFIMFSNRQRTSVLEIPLSTVYAPIALFLVATILRILFRIWRLMQGRAAGEPGPVSGPKPPEVSG